jgi:excisionase family DNA binding protein
MPDTAPTAAPERLMKMRDAAKVLCLGERTVWQMVKDGVLPAVRFTNAVRIDPADLRALIEKLKAAAPNN